MTHPDQPEKKEEDVHYHTAGMDEDCDICGPDRPADAPKAMGEGPCRVECFGDCAHVAIGDRALALFTPADLKRHNTAGEAAEAYALPLNQAIFSWLKAKGWAAPGSVIHEKAKKWDGLESVQNLEKELSALKEKAAILYEVLCERGEHDSDCIRGLYRGGRPTGSGGYEVQYGEKWYQLRPVDQTPNCNCGLEGAIAAYAKAEGGKECRHHMPLDWNCNACSDSGDNPRGKG